jgi:hypothetical protein
MTMILRCIKDDKVAYNGREYVNFMAGRTYILPQEHAEQLLRKGSAVEIVAEIQAAPMLFVGTQIKIEQIVKKVVVAQYKNKGFFSRLFKR